MSKRFRDIIAGPLTIDYFHSRIAEGWVVTAVEWMKPAAEDELAAAEADQGEEVPYGQRISDDCGHLVEHPTEMEVLSFIYDGVISGSRPTYIAAELNKAQYRTRRGSPWTAAQVFELMPRLIELSPKLQRRPDWPSHRARLQISA